MHPYGYPLLCLLALLPCTGARAQATGKVITNLTMRSEILGMERNYAVYLPPGYAADEREYPVLYLLHGYSDNHTGWVQFGEVKRITDAAIADGTTAPMIIIMPDGDTEKIGYFNRPGGEWNYEDHFFTEFMPQVESKFRILKKKRFRAIAGLSMGGGGAFTYALRHPELFSAACPLSAWAGGMTTDDVAQRYVREGETFTDAQIQEHFERNNFVELVKAGDKEKISSVRWYIDCGDDDFLFAENSLVHMELRKKEVPHEYRVRDGAHNWTYWREALPQVLGFVGKGFRQF
ncbi:alpha/beta hydrolase [Neolewinella antarctica]|uniref:Enterochelin esterase-like enzyme n=1 Tax=Neolewinella antarctica TaxID=442734 RepID=A0ABX0XDT0_9BACT|nr:alpha/beta hydrolase-fold protein [Neolewinella antarctica]NJC27476.1 enterochelin esterase-like enzyme [Neolewinella antarctica]